MYFIYDGTKVSYTYKGEGKNTILLLHGWGGDKNSFEPLTNGLSLDAKYLSIDFPPFGESDEPRRTWGMSDYTQMTITLLNKLKIDKVDIISHSFGGRVAICLGSDYTERVKRIVLIDSAGLKPKFNLARFFRVRIYKLKKRLKIKNKNCGSSDYQILSDNMKNTFVKIVNENLKSKAKNIPVPTLLIWGENDKETPLYMGKKLNKLVKNSGIVILKGVGHFPQYERAKKVTNILNIFLKDVYEY